MFHLQEVDNHPAKEQVIFENNDAMKSVIQHILKRLNLPRKFITQGRFFCL